MNGTHLQQADTRSIIARRQTSGVGNTSAPSGLHPYRTYDPYSWETITVNRVAEPGRGIDEQDTRKSRDAEANGFSMESSHSGFRSSKVVCGGFARSEEHTSEL